MKKTIKFTDKCELVLNEKKNISSIGQLKINGLEILTEEINFRFKYVISGTEVYRNLKWQKAKPSKRNILLEAELPVNEMEKYTVKLKISFDKIKAGKQTYKGVRFYIYSTETIPWAGEIEMEVPLNAMGRTVFVQDLYTKNKCCKIDKNWAGISDKNWHAARSPLDLVVNDESAILGRLDGMNRLFMSYAKYDIKRGPIFVYRFHCESQCKWKSAVFSLLATKGEFKGEAKQNLWFNMFMDECERFRKLCGIKKQEPAPMANYSIEGGTPGCAPKKGMTIKGTFNEYTEKAIAYCKRYNYKNLLVGNPCVTHRSEGIWEKCTKSITYDSRCATIEFEISPKYGGREQFRRFCDEAHTHGINVYMWFPAYHLSNYSRYLTEHPDWVLRNPNGSTATFIFFHLTFLSAANSGMRKEILGKIKELKDACNFDGLWLDSYNHFCIPMDYSRRHGVFTSGPGIGMIRAFQKMGLKIVNEGFAPFGVRGDGESLFFIGQEHMAIDTSIFTYYGNNGKILSGDTYFKFIANKAPLTIAVEYVPKKYQEKLAFLNAIYNEVGIYMKYRKILENNKGILWSDGNKTEILFSYATGIFEVNNKNDVVDISNGERVKINRGKIKSRKNHVYRITEIERF